MNRIGALKAASHESASAAQQARPISERLRHSWSLFLAYRDGANLAPVGDRVPTLYARARALGLYRP
jgi:hypothetical protein